MRINSHLAKTACPSSSGTLLPDHCSSLVDELSALSPEFKKWWNAHQVRRSSSGEKIVRHPKKGGMKLAYSTFQSNDNPDLKLVLYKVEAFGRS